MQEQTVSIHKIIVFVVFVCAALITSLFVFHISHSSKPAALAEGEGTLFTAPRDIQAFELAAGDASSFTQKNFLKHWTLLFFGFTHCDNVCPTTLEKLNRVYGKLHTTYPTLQVVLISLDPERDTPTVISHYTHSFNPNFIGVTGSMQALRKLQSQLGIVSVRDSTDSTHYQLQHTASIFLINPQGKWAGLFNNGLTPDQFSKAFETSVRALS